MGYHPTLSELASGFSYHRQGQLSDTLLCEGEGNYEEGDQDEHND